jgi:hypothetical protein
VWLRTSAWWLTTPAWNLIWKRTSRNSVLLVTWYSSSERKDRQFIHVTYISDTTSMANLLLWAISRLHLIMIILCLHTHFKSYETIKTQDENGKHPDDSFENCQFIIYTNCELEGRPGKNWKPKDPLKILNSESQNGSYVTFYQGSYEEEFKETNFKNPKKGKEENTDSLSFFSKFKLFQCQSNVIKKELRKASGTSSDTESIYQKIKECFDEWCRKSSNVERITEMSLLKQIGELYIKKIQSDSKRYEEEECKEPDICFTEKHMKNLFEEWHGKK